MRRKDFILSLVLPGAIYCLLAWAVENPVIAQPKPGPGLVVKESSHDFKEVPEGTVIEHCFTILNQGQETLLIENVHPG